MEEPRRNLSSAWSSRTKEHITSPVSLTEIIFCPRFLGKEAQEVGSSGWLLCCSFHQFFGYYYLFEFNVKRHYIRECTYSPHLHHYISQSLERSVLSSPWTSAPPPPKSTFYKTKNHVDFIYFFKFGKLIFKTHPVGLMFWSGVF